MKSKLKWLTILITVLLLGFGNDLYSQSNLSALDVQKLVQNKQFSFTATSVIPLKGSPRYFTESYDVKVQGNVLVSYLPYFGVAQTAPVTSDDAGIKFTSGDFTYTYEKGKKDSWDVQIKFNDQKQTRQFHFIIFDNGNASLDVSSTFRDPISFNGSIRSNN